MVKNVALAGPALLIAGCASGQGKTTVTAALARYHTRLGRRVRVFKTGPDFIDPTILEAASGASVYNIDCWMVGTEHSRALLATAAREADLILVEGAMGLHDGEPSAADLAVTFSPRETQTYSFALVDDVGLENRLPARFTLRMLKDEPPRVRVKLDSVGAMVTAEAVLPIETEYADTYGLATAELGFQTSRDGAPSGDIEIPGFTPHATTFSTSLNWPVAQAGVSAGERLALLGRATDFDDVSGPNAAQSAEIALRIVTREELLAELARREQEARGDLERLIDVQEQIRGKLLSELVAVQSGQGVAELASRLTPIERRQRTVAGSVNLLRQQFEQILAELRVNQLSTNAAEQRVGGAIIEPLGRLAKRDLVLAADDIRQWGRDSSRETGGKLDSQQATLLAEMREILANMLQWEGYQEAVNMLRDILRIQAELEAETRRNLEQQGSDIFDK